MDDLKVKFVKISMPKLFEDDIENSHNNTNLNLRQDLTITNDQNNTVPSISPVIRNNQVQSDLNIKG